MTRAIVEGLPAGVELDEREQVLLAAAAKQADAVEALEADIAARGYVVGSRLNPSVPEARQGRTALGRLLAGIDLPDSRSFTAIRATKGREAAMARSVVRFTRPVDPGPTCTWRC